jgi:hypothetical protein
MVAYKTHPSTVAALTYEEGILVCGAATCPNAIVVDYLSPAPAKQGWVLRDGWWLCPAHKED